MSPAAHRRGGVVQERKRVHIVLLPAFFLSRAVGADLLRRTVVHGGDVGVVFLALRTAAHRFVQLAEGVRQGAHLSGGIPAHAPLALAESRALHHGDDERHRLCREHEENHRGAERLIQRREAWVRVPMPEYGERVGRKEGQKKHEPSLPLENARHQPREAVADREDRRCGGREIHRQPRDDADESALRRACAERGNHNAQHRRRAAKAENVHDRDARKRHQHAAENQHATGLPPQLLPFQPQPFGGERHVEEIGRKPREHDFRGKIDRYGELQELIKGVESAGSAHHGGGNRRHEPRPVRNRRLPQKKCRRKNEHERRHIPKRPRERAGDEIPCRRAEDARETAETAARARRHCHAERRARTKYAHASRHEAQRKMRAERGGFDRRGAVDAQRLPFPRIAQQDGLISQ